MSTEEMKQSIKSAFARDGQFEIMRSADRQAKAAAEIAVAREAEDAGAAEALLGMYGPVDAPEGLEDEIDDEDASDDSEEDDEDD